MREPDRKGTELTDFVLGELAEADRPGVESRLARDEEAALEVERLETAMAMLRSVPDEEPPRRIAFVSDKVFEPRWYQRWWQQAGGLALASAMLSAAILGHGVLMRPVPTAAPPAVAQLQTVNEEEIGRRVDQAVAKAVAATRAENLAEQKRMVSVALKEAEKNFAMERQADRVAVEASVDYLRKQMNRMLYLASNQTGGAQ